MSFNTVYRNSPNAAYCTDARRRLGSVGEEESPEPAGVSGVVFQGRSGQDGAGQDNQQHQQSQCETQGTVAHSQPQ